MYTSNTSATPFWPFDVMTPVSAIPVRDKNGGLITGGFTGPALMPTAAFEWCFNTKAMLLQIPVYYLTSTDGLGDGMTPSGSLVVFRYTVDGSDKPIRFGSVGNAPGSAVSFFIDFTLGKTKFNSSGWTVFTPVSQLSMRVATTGGQVSANVLGSPTNLGNPSMASRTTATF